MSESDIPTPDPEEQARFKETLKEEVQKALQNIGEVPRILVMGHTGAGKSSLINALLNKEAQKTDIVPCTMGDFELDWNAGAAEIKLVDIPGFGEAEKHEKRVEDILQFVPQTHLAMLLVGAPNRACEHEREFLEKLRSTEPTYPIILVGNRIDMINPVRSWEPTSLQLEAPSTKKEINIREWGDYIKSACQMEHISLVAAGERFDAYEDQYGLDDLKELIIDRLPEAAQNMAARVLLTEGLKKKRAMYIIWGATTAAGAAALTPIPFADSAIITSIQSGMIVNIAWIYGIQLDWKQAIGLLGPALGFFAGRAAFQGLIKLIPGLGSIAGAGIGAAIATTATFAIGMTYLHFFIHGNFRPSKEEVILILREQYEKAKGMKDEMIEKAKEKVTEDKSA